ncbi:DUF1648 domain-containing protein [Bacillus massiliigorillae]|uniref:DUF1648 domain-containing protein n=1 Tax=Bacillus massiliigorillae TaxID=1243664 RepID=UPI00039D0062|nr:DUF5808 domain-containing protein [Bacillus massiliigorillae]
MTTFEHIALTLSLLPAIIMLAGTPYLTRKTEQFGVTIPEKVYNNKTLKQLRKKFALQTSSISIVILIITAILLPQVTSENAEASLIVLCTIGIISIPFTFYLKAHKQMKQWQQKQDWYNDKKQERLLIQTSFHHTKLVYSHTWFLIPFALSICTAIITFLLYKNAPTQIPTHFDFQGRVNNYSDKSSGILALFPCLQILMTIMFFGINVSIQKARQQIDTVNPKKSKQQNILFRRRWSSFIIGTSILIVLLLFISQLSMLTILPGPIITIIIYSFIAIQLIWVVYLTITTGQGGSRIKIPTEEGSNYTNRNEDIYWKAGLFYVNRNDSSIFVEKRFGIGWTLNFGNPISWIITVLFIVLLVGIIMISTILGS